MTRNELIDYITHIWPKDTDARDAMKEGTLIGLSFRPNLSDAVPLRVVDYNSDTGQYKKGTIGHINGFNYRSIEIPESADLEWLVGRIS